MRPATISTTTPPETSTATSSSSAAAQARLSTQRTSGEEWMVACRTEMILHGHTSCGSSRRVTERNGSEHASNHEPFRQQLDASFEKTTTSSTNATFHTWPRDGSRDWQVHTHTNDNGWLTKDQKTNGVFSCKRTSWSPFTTHGSPRAFSRLIATSTFRTSSPCLPYSTPTAVTEAPNTTAAPHKHATCACTHNVWPRFVTSSTQWSRPWVATASASFATATGPAARFCSRARSSSLASESWYRSSGFPMVRLPEWKKISTEDYGTQDGSRLGVKFNHGCQSVASVLL
ncbi:hypothetical protein IWX49DRAFT_324561 [Phyllosticta citricarpa]|uniref:Uncharacterized protein n=1 Tax=Phyllosticta paracitricarpa TaxID=2016321 RepID=A0ABR1MXX5_9PEZI